ncbi:hypothetical protein ABIB62_004371 [Mucilaginibacter sp. UYP25]|jgi:hypothetical protein|uniref:DUF6527 family protein n=1 Tax=unclassified Mucilaginibacter TaxID=2617802 RepID=UPI00339718B8
MQIFHRIIHYINRLTALIFKKWRPDKTLKVNVLQPILNSKGNYIFYCPGCEANHLVSIAPKAGTYHTLTGTLARPTIRASVMVAGNKKLGIHRCHSFVTEGMIAYLDDCTHPLAGKTVSMEPM